MHSALCERCGGHGWHWAMRAGVVVRRNPARKVSVRSQQRCQACDGHGTTPTPGTLLSGQRLPAL